MEYLMGFLAGLAIGAGGMGVLLHNTMLEMRERVIKLRVELDYAKREKSATEVR